MEFNKIQIIKFFLDNVYRISNKEYQKRVWIEGAGPECHDFDEAVNDFFDEGEPILNDRQGYGLSENEYRSLKKFYDAFRVFADNNDFPEEFIDTSEWAEIMNLAKEVLKSFDYPRKIKNQMLSDFIKNTKKFCDMALQEKTQVCAEEPKRNDLYEAISEILAEDCILKNCNDFGITEEQFELLKNLGRKLRDFADKYRLNSAEKLTKKLLDLPEWREINSMSRKVVEIFDLEK